VTIVKLHSTTSGHHCHHRSAEVFEIDFEEYHISGNGKNQEKKRFGDRITQACRR